MAVRILVDYMNAQMQEIAKHKWYLSERASKDIGWQSAIEDFVARGFAAKFHDDYFIQHNITAIDGEVEETLNGDSCLMVEVKAVAHSHDTGKEVILEDEIMSYCFGRRENCPNRKEFSPGLYLCERARQSIPRQP